MPEKAFIPAPNQHLLGLVKINQAMLEFLQLNNVQKTATLDMDATLVVSSKDQALYCYKKFKGYQPFNVWWYLPGDEMEELHQQTLPFPNMKINNKRYKIFGIVTNLDWAGEDIIHWLRKRCGNSEHIHSEMKGEFCGGQLPSGKFGANAAWWWIMVLALNLTLIMKSIALNKSLKKKRMKSLRFSVINISGRVINKGKGLVIRLSKGHPSFDLLLSVRRKIASLCRVNSSLPVPDG